MNKFEIDYKVYPTVAKERHSNIWGIWVVPRQEFLHYTCTEEMCRRVSKSINDAVRQGLRLAEAIDGVLPQVDAPKPKEIYTEISDKYPTYVRETSRNPSTYQVVNCITGGYVWEGLDLGIAKHIRAHINYMVGKEGMAPALAIRHVVSNG